LLRYNATSQKWENAGVDSTPTANSANLVSSGGVKAELDSMSSQIGDIANSEQISTSVSGNGFTFATVPVSTKIISVVCENPDFFARIVKTTDGTKWVFQVVGYNGTFAPNGTNCTLTYYYNRL
jgi:hypothetical protein